MVTLAQRLEQLRTQAGLSRAALSARLGMPKGAFEKFETGRQTPSKEQQEKIAAYFDVSLSYLRGESGDPTRQGSWMDQDMSGPDEQVYVPVPRPGPKRPKQAQAQQGSVMDALLASRQVQESMRGVILETLRSPEGQAILEQVVRRVMGKV